MDKLIFGLTVAAIGIAIVFCGLVLLIGLIKIVTLVSAGKTKKAEAKQPIAAPAPAAAPAPVAEEEAPAQDDALIAVITAAIAMMMEEGQGFTVKHVRRIQNSPAWQRAGRDEQVYSRF